MKFGTFEYFVKIAEGLELKGNDLLDLCFYYNKGVVVDDYSGFYIKLTREGTTIIDKSKALSHYKIAEKTNDHPTCGEDYISKFNTFSDYEVVGNIHNK